MFFCYYNTDFFNFWWFWKEPSATIALMVTTYLSRCSVWPPPAPVHNCNLFPNYHTATHTALKHRTGSQTELARHRQKTSSELFSFPPKRWMASYFPRFESFIFLYLGSYVASVWTIQPEAKTSKDQLKVVWREIWNNLPVRSLKRAVLSFGKRLQLRTEADGCHIKHLLK